LVEAQNGEIGYLPHLREKAGAPTGSEFYILMPIAQTPEDDME
jgi:hypothetical protein